jgi:hypothetical protein
MQFVEAPAFTRHVSDYLDADEYRELQTGLVNNPEQGDLMPGTGGFRKLRWADPRRGKGRRGGLRIVYYHFKADQQIWLMTIYDKNEAADLTPKEKRTLRAAVDAELKARETTQTATGREARRRR